MIESLPNRVVKSDTRANSKAGSGLMLPARLLAKSSDTPRRPPGVGAEPSLIGCVAEARSWLVGRTEKGRVQMPYAPHTVAGTVVAPIDLGGSEADAIDGQACIDRTLR
jgi:hypothetical protein